ncbi:hypothetical protein [Erythrobacter litoralis]|uniref:Uncharacterized protein n=1 Tax=Erythrobacter litoralis (strain HTCC2594) TaxID=314225 RepID=Q2N8R2_ERYLH|nr:hypothetical protein [Erythrobacter litoralis]ABC63929.1 hypothetical protein ELI_09185 [Erythrobacter litoralis HTCC2594]
MPIWIELVILLLFTYAIGLGFGWLLWGRTPIVADAPEPLEDI